MVVACCALVPYPPLINVGKRLRAVVLDTLILLRNTRNFHQTAKDRLVPILFIFWKGDKVGRSS